MKISANRKSIFLAFSCSLLFSVFGNETTFAERQAYIMGMISPQTGLASKDGEIRRKAIYDYFREKGEESVPVLEKLAGDDDEGVAEVLVECIRTLKDQKVKERLFALMLQKTASERIKNLVNAANFNFYRVNVRLCERKDYDFSITKVKSVPLPQAGFRFATDSTQTGHQLGFFQPDYPDQRWCVLKIGTWSDQGYSGYRGIGWYRIKFTMPEKVNFTAVELAFAGVDEAAWVWLNGIYIGMHDEGGDGWNKPFALDVTSEILWDAENILVIRVRGNNGGVFKPITAEILK